MKIAILNRDEWEPQDIALVESTLNAETVSIWTAGSDVAIAMSTLPGNSRFYAWNRSWNERDEKWVLWADDLGKLLKLVKEKLECNS